MMNLHMYSWYSGKEYALPEKKVMSEFESGKSILSITDHNCVQANYLAQQLSGKYGFTYINGIEIDCTYKKRNISVIGYGIDINSRDFDEIDAKAADLEYEASLERLCETQAMGFHITETDMWNAAKDQYHPGNWSGRMFADVLLSRQEYKNHFLLQKYHLMAENKVDRYDALNHDLYSESGSCYVKINYMDVEEAIRTIHKNGGKAVFPSSGFLHMEDADIVELFSLGIDFIAYLGNYIVKQEKDMLLKDHAAS